MTGQPRITVVVPHYQDLDRLDRCLAALEVQTMPREAFTIVVSDNCSPAGPAAVAAVVAGRADLVEAPVPGAGPARNRGVEAATGQVLAFTDCDCIPEPRWLEAGVAALDRFDLVGGAMVLSVTDRGNPSGAEAFELVFAFDNRRYVEQEAFTVTANLFCRRDLFERVGPFRTEVSEDKEWCLRARDLGYRIGYCAEAVVAHPARRNWDELKLKWRRIASESFELAIQRGDSRALWVLRTWALLPSIPVHAVRLATSPKLPNARARLRGLGTLVASRLWRFAENHRLLLNRQK